ncbi:hypothetical protein L195_g054080 [Trifolium pratense]|uniref:Uncharacterized protein n=1 Tax=Trifolium pratense TaxID=57577 RepID=A0A2K3KE29_TRIPR|nr:hypothetical protein L195_g054080 [Trifolium pratense]
MGWRRRLFVWEEELLLCLLEALTHELVFSVAKDEWRWRLEDGGMFSVSSIYGYLGRVPSSDSMFNDHELGAACNKKVWKGYALIWHATIWRLWKSRNEIIFSNGIKDPDKIIDKIKASFVAVGVCADIIYRCACSTNGAGILGCVFGANWRGGEFFTRFRSGLFLQEQQAWLLVFVV